MNYNQMILLLSLASLVSVNVAANVAKAAAPTIGDCARACESTNEQVRSFRVEGGNAHCVCECKQGWVRKKPRAVCERQSATSRQPAEIYCRAKLQVAADERAIAQMNFGNDVRNFEMFSNVSKAQKAKFEEKVLNAFIDQGLEATTMAAMSAKSLNPVNVNAAIKKLRRSKLKNEAILSALLAIAKTKDKPTMAEAYKVLVKLVKSTKEGYDTGKGMAEDRKNAGLRFLLGALKVAQGNPELGVAVTGVEFGESFAYLGYISAKVADLTQVGDYKLVTLNSHIARMKGDMATLRRAKARWAVANTNAGRREPACNP